MKRILAIRKKSSRLLLFLMLFGTLSFSAIGQVRNAEFNKTIALKELNASSQVLTFNDLDMRMSIVDCQDEVSSISFLAFEIENRGEQTEFSFDLEFYKNGKKVEWMPSSILTYSLIISKGHVDLWSCNSLDKTLLVHDFIVREGSNDFMFDSIIVRNTVR